MNLITGDERDSDDPMLNALINFYKAFNSGDFLLMKDNWAQETKRVMCNALGGFKNGWDEIGSVYSTIFNGPAKVYVEFHDFRLFSSEQMFTIVGKERGSFKVADIKINLAIRTSRTYRNIYGEWKQIHHHGSIDNPELLQKYQTAVLNSIN